MSGGPASHLSADEAFAAMTLLRRRVEELEQEKHDLESMLKTATEHADILAEDLEKERDDLSTMLEMTTEHADTVEDELHQRAEAAVLRGEQQLRTIVEATPAPVTITRIADGVILYANATMGLLFGVPAQELLGLSIAELYFDLSQRDDLIQTLGSEKAVDDREVCFKRPDGVIVWAEVSLRQLDFNSEPSILSALHDITARKQAEIRLHQQVEELRLELEETSLSSSLARETGTTKFENLDAVTIKGGSTRLVAIHSFQGGTGKSSIVANLAGLLAAEGRRVGVIDAAMQSPGLHLLLGQAGKSSSHTLNDFLSGNCSIHQLAVDVTANIGRPVPGQLYLIPASVELGTMAHLVSQGYDAQRLTQSFHDLASLLRLDVLLIDTHPGLNEEALLTMQAVDLLLVVLRPTQRDFEGTGVTIQIARQLEVPQVMFIVNQLSETSQLQAVRARVEAAFDNQVMAIVPYATEFMTFDEDGLFVLRHADHPVSMALRQASVNLMMVPTQR